MFILFTLVGFGKKMFGELVISEKMGEKKLTPKSFPQKATKNRAFQKLAP